MSTPERQPGPLESAIRGFHPTQAVLYEAGALDRELVGPERSWEALLRGIESFASHYPAVLLQSPRAIQALGRACLQGIAEAPGLTLRTRSASLLLSLVTGVLEEVQREDPANVPVPVPEELTGLLGDLRHEEVGGYQDLVPQLLLVGRQLLLTMEESPRPDLWNTMLSTTTGLLLAIVKHRVEGEPAYAGTWDSSAWYEELETGRLALVRRERILDDLAWLGALQDRLAEPGTMITDVFLELSAYTRREEREAAWENWFGAVAERATERGLPARALRVLSTEIAGWIRTAQDRRFLSRLASILRRSAAKTAASAGAQGLATALKTIGAAIVERLEAESGRGEVDAALADLGFLLADLVRRGLASAGDEEAEAILRAGLRARTGPVVGKPATREDVAWRLQLSLDHPAAAARFVPSLLVGFSLEDVLLRDDQPPPGAPRLGDVLTSLLTRPWERDLLHQVRALLRSTPLSPLHIGSPTTRAHLLALDPENREGSYLHDLKETILSRSGIENLRAVEGVLHFWSSGNAEHLDNLASPESLAQLPMQVARDHLGQVQEMIGRLRRHVPGARRTGVAWLARMPPAYYQPETLIKVAGFPGCTSRAVSLLVHLLEVFRDLTTTYRAPNEGVPAEPEEMSRLFDRSSALLAQRQELAATLFVPGTLDAEDPATRLQTFGQDLTLVRAEDRHLEELARRFPGEAIADELGTGGRLLGHMLRQATLSGLGPRELVDLADELTDRALAAGGADSVLRKVAGLVVSTRNRLAAVIHPHVEDSVQRLLANPLSRPAEAYRGLFEAHRGQGKERLASRLGSALVDDLLAADGGFLLLEEFVHRLLHMVERY